MTFAFLGQMTILKKGYWQLFLNRYGLYGAVLAPPDAESINGFFGELNEGQRHILSVAICF